MRFKIYFVYKLFKILKLLFRKYNIKKVGLFNPYILNIEKKKSDIDLFIYIS